MPRAYGDSHRRNRKRPRGDSRLDGCGQLTELRTALDGALSALSLAPLNDTPAGVGTIVSGQHFQELRNAIR